MKKTSSKYNPYFTLKEAFIDFVTGPTESTWTFLVKMVGDMPASVLSACPKPQKAAPKDKPKAEAPAVKAPWIPLREFAWEIGDPHYGKNIKRYLDSVSSPWVKNVHGLIYIHPSKAWNSLMKSERFKAKYESGEWLPPLLPRKEKED